MEYFWIPDKEEGFILKQKDQINDHSYSQNKQTENINDLAKLIHLHQASILHVLNQHYHNNKIYTYSGLILIAVNPFKKIDKLPNQPHPDQIAIKCYQNLPKNQSILVNGESGAGKTETTKIILKHLTQNLQKNNNQLLTNQILASNSILECFGNAKTIRNHNSSRFGKFIKINYNNQKAIVSGWIDTYLLEQIRITSTNLNERCFHIFYQLFDNHQDFNYLQTDVQTDPYLDDQKMYQHMVEGFEFLQVNKNHTEQIFDLVKCVAYLGNITTSALLNSLKTEDEYQKKICQIINIDIETFSRCINKQKISVSDEIYYRELSPEQIKNKIDTLARFIYNNLFNHLVNLINNKIGDKNAKNNPFIGILDIFGFEVFEHNSLEQLAINYTNENLQNLFNLKIFQEEQKLYQTENIEWDFIDFPNNQDILQLISKKHTGIFSVLNEVCRFAKGTDKKFLEMIHKNHQKNNCFQANQLDIAKNKFKIVHYAGTVEYNVYQFVEKNRNNISNDLIEILSSCNNEIISLFNLPTGKKDKGKVIELFQKQLNLLIKNINTTEINFIRCLKPNDLNIPDNFNRNRILQQLAYNGVLEAVKVSRSGFPVRFSKKEYLERFWMIPKAANYGLHGKTMIFFKDYQYKEIEKIRDTIISKHLIIIQKNIRKFTQYRKFNRIKKQIIKIQSTIRQFFSRKELIRLIKIKAANIIKHSIKGYTYRSQYLRFRKSLITLQHKFRNWLDLKQKQLDAAIKIQSQIRRFNISKWYQYIYQKITILQSFNRIILARNQIVELKKYKKSLAGAKKIMNKLEQDKLKLDNEKKLLEQEKKDLSLFNNELQKANINLTSNFNKVNKETDNLKNEIDILHIQQNTQRNTKIKLIEQFNQMNQEILEENERLRRILYQERKQQCIIS
jgi:myosin V